MHNWSCEKYGHCAATPACVRAPPGLACLRACRSAGLRVRCAKPCPERPSPRLLRLRAAPSSLRLDPRLRRSQLLLE